MRLATLLLLSSYAFAQSPPAPASAPAITFTFSSQTAPFPLKQEGIGLYSAIGCQTGTQQVLAFSAMGLEQAAAERGLGLQEPATYSGIFSAIISKSTTARLLNGTKWISLGLTIGSGAVTAYKSAEPGITNTATWGKITAGTAALDGILQFTENSLQSAQSTQATITTTVQQKLIQDMNLLFTVPVGTPSTPKGCSTPVLFFATGLLTVSGSPTPLPAMAPAPKIRKDEE